MGVGLYREAHEGARPDCCGCGGCAALGPLLPGARAHAQEDRRILVERHLQALAGVGPDSCGRGRGLAPCQGHLPQRCAVEAPSLLLLGADREALCGLGGGCGRGRDLPPHPPLPQGHRRVRAEECGDLHPRDRPPHSGLGKAYRQCGRRRSHGRLHHRGPWQQSSAGHHDAGLHCRILRDLGLGGRGVEGHTAPQGCAH
mmetsp:Transcript_50222/g.107589  ORF Transcript_50222/g.107589 Transcript_50222/m.107589 type:complete len:200 (-) Transcript_50222:553-1152(-)